MSMIIGLYVQRATSTGAALSKFHKVESEIADRVITHCGLEMSAQIAINSELHYNGNPPAEEVCTRCPAPAAS